MLSKYVTVFDSVKMDTTHLYCHVLQDNGFNSAYIKYVLVNLNIPPSIGEAGDNYITGEDYILYRKDENYMFTYEAKILGVKIR